MSELKSQTVILLNGSTQKVNEITYGEYIDTRNKDGEFDNKIALIMACTGLTHEQINTLDMPEINDLYSASVTLNDPTNDEAAQLTAGQTVITLKSPVSTILGDKSNTVKIAMPSVSMGRELDKIKNHSLRVEYMIKATTKITDLYSMRMSDYTLLVLAVPDFFAQGVAFFRANKQKIS